MTRPIVPRIRIVNGGCTVGPRRAGWRLLVPFLLLSFPCSGSAQTTVGHIADMHHTSWIAGRSLPVTGVTGVARTPDGYLWLGSTVGLVRFDGARFVVLDGRNTPALRSERPGGHTPLLVDRSGTLWIRRADDALVHFRDARFTVAVEADSARPRIDYASEDGTGRVWLVGGRRARIWRDGRLADPDLPRHITDDGITGVVAHNAAGVWVGTSSRGLWHVTSDAARRLDRPHAPADALVRPLLHARDGRLWVGGDRLQIFDGVGWSQVRVEDVPVLAYRVAEAVDGTVWLATAGSGVVRWRQDGIDRFSAASGLTSPVARGLLLDVEGSVWITTEGGLDQLRPAAFTTIGRPQGLPFDAPLTAFGDATGAVWAMDHASFRTYRLDGGAVRGHHGALAAEAIPGTDVAFASAVDGGVWLYRLHDDLVYRYRDGKATPIQAAPGLAWTGPRRGVEAADGTLWLGAGAGGFGTVRGFHYEPFPLPGLGDAPPVAALAAGAAGSVWVSVARQPLIFEIAAGAVVRRIDVASGLPAPVLHLAHESGDTLWATTADGALLRIAGNRITAVGVPEVANALAAGTVALLLSRGHLWVGSAGGIARLPLDGLHAAADGAVPPPVAEWFGEPDGLRIGRTNGTNAPAGFRAGDGRLWFSTPAGLAVVDPENMPLNPVPPLAIIEEVRVAGGAAVGTDGTIAPNPERLEVHFTATSLRTPERVHIEYRLDGADPDWIPSEAVRSAAYTQLTPGRYAFRVRARNEDGVPGVVEATMAFRVLPAWYQSAWFHLLATIVVATAGAALVAAAIRASHRAATNRIRERYEAALDERTRMARELHDTLLQSFTGITLHLQSIEPLIVDAPADATAALARILALADDALREARMMIWDMRAPELEGHALPEALETVAKRTVDGAPLTLSFAVQGPQRRLPLELETTVLRVGREAAANVVRHAGAQAVSITLTYLSDAVTLQVRDDGRGIDPERPAAMAGTGHWGIRGMHERAARAGGSLEIRRGADRGTAVELRLPTGSAPARVAHDAQTSATTG
jgi:signal transduction histidine kinase/ligand-binding sensor domain-containing protein